MLATLTGLESPVQYNRLSLILVGVPAAWAGKPNAEHVQSLAPPKIIRKPLLHKSCARGGIVMDSAHLKEGFVCWMEQKLRQWRESQRNELLCKILAYNLASFIRCTNWA